MTATQVAAAGVRLASDALEVVVDPARGGEIRHLGRPGGRNVLAAPTWRAPLPARRSAPYDDGQLDWQSEYRGGWQELFPNAGDACVVDGVPLPYHGEVSTARWDVEWLAEDEVVLRTPARLPLVLERRMRLGGDGATLLVEERVTCEGTRPVPFVWGHHPAFPAVPGTRIDVPAVRVRADDGWRPEALDVRPGAEGRWPLLAGPDGPVDLSVVPDGPAERYCFLTDLPTGWAALRPPAGDAVALAWDVEVWPHAWLWLERGGPDFPWFGRGSLLAVEPQRACPGDGLAGAIARGQALWIEPGAAVEAWLTVALLPGGERPVRAVARDGSVELGAPGER